MVGEKSFYDDKYKYITIVPSEFYNVLFIGIFFLFFFLLFIWLGRRAKSRNQSETQKLKAVKHVKDITTTSGEESISSTTQFVDVCPINQCAVSIATGVKRCPQGNSTIIYNIGQEVCSLPDRCSSEKLPFAELSSGETNESGICEPGRRCRCLAKKVCASEVTAYFQLQNGNATEVFTFAQKLKPDGEDLVLDSLGDQFCKINPNYLDSLKGCVFDKTQNPLTNIVNCISGNPCERGVLSYNVDSKPSRQFGQYDPVLKNLTKNKSTVPYYMDPYFFTVSCVTGKPCYTGDPISSSVERSRYFPDADSALSNITYFVFQGYKDDTLSYLAYLNKIEKSVLMDDNKIKINKKGNIVDDRIKNDKLVDDTLLLIRRETSLYYSVWNPLTGRNECIRKRPFLLASFNIDTTSVPDPDNILINKSGTLKSVYAYVSEGLDDNNEIIEVWSGRDFSQYQQVKGIDGKNRLWYNGDTSDVKNRLDVTVVTDSEGESEGSGGEVVVRGITEDGRLKDFDIIKNGKDYTRTNPPYLVLSQFRY